MDTEKITINLGAIDLGQIDLLVDQGFYSNRTDFIRTAIRNQLTTHGNDISGIKTYNRFGLDVVGEGKKPVGKDGAEDLSIGHILSQGFTGTGLFSLNIKDLEQVRATGKKMRIKMVGMLIIDKKVPPELVEETFQSVKIYGIIKASDEVKRALERLKD